MINHEEMSERKLKILHAIIQNYLETGEPVGSRTISKYTDLNLSSATIRNEMADLEEMGYIIQPHTSAGRIPSDKGYRLYVDMLMEEKEQELNEMQDQMLDKADKMDQLLKQAAKVLATNTNYATMVSTPMNNSNKIKFIQLSMVDEEQVIAVIKEQRLIVRQAFCPAQGGDGGALRHFGQGHDFGIGVIGFDFPVNGMVADMLLQHHKGDIGTVHKFGNALGCPIEKRAVVDLDQGLGHHKAVFKKAAAAPGHRHYKVQLCHIIPLSHRGQPAWRTRSRSRGAGPRGCRSSVPSHSTLWRGCYRTGNTC